MKKKKKNKIKIKKIKKKFDPEKYIENFKNEC